MKGRPAYRKQLTAAHEYRADDAECCTVCGLPETNRHHRIANRESQPAQPEETQLRRDIDG